MRAAVLRHHSGPLGKVAQQCEKFAMSRAGTISEFLDGVCLGQFGQTREQADARSTGRLEDR